MKKRNFKSRIDNSFLYDLMLYRDIEMDLKRDKKNTGRKENCQKGKEQRGAKNDAANLNKHDH
ncbi:MAG: hypothetical protein IPG99_08000 [Ignavibacteria bacterium]|nr:hypothetical protein [Ignavibacteria bacterium]